MLKALILLLISSVSLLAADVTGTWNFDVQTDQGSGTPTFVLKQDGEKLSGTYSGQLGEAKVDGTVKGEEVTIEFEASGYKIRYIGKLKGDTKISGKVDLGGQATGTFTGVKK